ncbi:MAG: hypothetical protein ACYS0G_12710 [Planctomycetota bacterium]|jgi:hypothetical protein
MPAKPLIGPHAGNLAGRVVDSRQARAPAAETAASGGVSAETSGDM